MREYVCLCVDVCVCERERKSERKSAYMCVKQTEIVCVCERERLRVREYVCVCGERESERYKIHGQIDTHLWKRMDRYNMLSIIRQILV